MRPTYIREDHLLGPGYISDANLIQGTLTDMPRMGPDPTSGAPCREINPHTCLWWRLFIDFSLLLAYLLQLPTYTLLGTPSQEATCSQVLVLGSSFQETRPKTKEESKALSGFQVTWLHFCKPPPRG